MLFLQSLNLLRFLLDLIVCHLLVFPEFLNFPQKLIVLAPELLYLPLQLGLFFFKLRFHLDQILVVLLYKWMYLFDFA